MKTVLVNYRGTAIETRIKSHWNELTRSELAFIITHFIGNIERLYETVIDEEGKPKRQVKDWSLLRTIMAGVTLKLWNVNPMVLKEIPGEQLDRLVDGYMPVHFLFEDNLLTRSPIAYYWHRGICYAGPADDWKGTDFEEYVYADAQWVKYQRSRKPEDLDLFAALLLRPMSLMAWVRDDVDKRVVFNPQKAEKRLPMTRKMSHASKYALFLWWEGCRNKQTKIRKRVFGGGGSGKGGGSMLDVMMNMSKDIFGSYDATRRVNVKLALARMEMLLKQAEEIENT